MSFPWAEFLGVLALLFGAVLLAAASWGILKFEDLYQRLHAGGLATSLGTLSFFLGLALLVGGLEVWLTAAGVVSLSFLTGPLASHFIAQAGYLNGVPLSSDTLVDELSQEPGRTISAAQPKRP